MDNSNILSTAATITDSNTSTTTDSNGSLLYEPMEEQYTHHQVNSEFFLTKHY